MTKTTHFLVSKIGHFHIAESVSESVTEMVAESENYFATSEIGWVQCVCVGGGTIVTLWCFWEFLTPPELGLVYRV